jgi:hypothetical protein
VQVKETLRTSVLLLIRWFRVRPPGAPPAVLCLHRPFRDWFVDRPNPLLRSCRLGPSGHIEQLPSGSWRARLYAGKTRWPAQAPVPEDPRAARHRWRSRSVRRRYARARPAARYWSARRGWTLGPMASPISRSLFRQMCDVLDLRHEPPAVLNRAGREPGSGRFPAPAVIVFAADCFAVTRDT